MVMFAHRVNGELVMTRMPRSQAEALQNFARKNPQNSEEVHIPHTPATPVAPEQLRYEEPVEHVPFVPDDELVYLPNDIDPVQRKKRIAKIALISALAMGPMVGADYAVTTMARGEVPGPEVIVEDMWQLPGQLVEAGQNFGGFVDQVKTMVDTMNGLRGGK